MSLFELSPRWRAASVGFSLAVVSAAAMAQARVSVTTQDQSVIAGRLVFSTVAAAQNRPPKTVTITNAGNAPLTVSSLTFGPSRETANAKVMADHQRAADFSFVTPPALPATLAPGATLTLSIAFKPGRAAFANVATPNPVHTNNGENYATLNIATNDPATPVAVLDLAGFNQAAYEGNFEPATQEIVRLFGYTVDVGTEHNLFGGAKALMGDEVYSPFWVRAFAPNAVQRWMLGIYSSRSSTVHNNTQWFPKPGSGGSIAYGYALAGRANDDSPTGTEVPGSDDDSGGENQKVIPKIYNYVSNTAQTPNGVQYFPTTAFAPGVANGATNDDQNGVNKVHNWRMYPLRDQRGVLIPHQWLAAVDPNNDDGPTSGKNYDYNDNIYRMVNLRPEDPTLDPSVGGLVPGMPALINTFSAAVPGTVADAGGQGTGFNSVQTNKNDTFVSKPSYNPSLLQLDTVNGLLNVTTAPGLNIRSDNNLVNGLVRTFDGRVARFVAGVRIAGPLTNLTTPFQQAGVMFGQSQDNYFKVVALAAGSGAVDVEFAQEFKGVAGTASKVRLSNPATVQSLELYIFGDPRAGTVRAGYRVITAFGDTGVSMLPTTVTVPQGLWGRFFAAQSKAGLIASNKNGNSVVVPFDSFAITSTETTSPRTVIARVRAHPQNVGFVDPEGNVWSPDTGLFTSPNNNVIVETTANPNAAIANTDKPELYRSYRGRIAGNSSTLSQRSITYNIPVSGYNMVDVRLHFAENYWGAPDTSGAATGGPNRRVFDITVEGNKLLDNFDINAAAGAARTAVIVPIERVAVNDGMLTITFNGTEIDYPAISGIEVFASP